MHYTEGDKKLENEVSKAVDCCDEPKVEFSDWRWASDFGGWRFDGMCHNCWEMFYGKIHAVEVEVEG